MVERFADQCGLGPPSLTAKTKGHPLDTKPEAKYLEAKDFACYVAQIVSVKTKRSSTEPLRLGQLMSIM